MYQGPFVTSDLHLGHARIIAYADRPFESVDDMHETLIQRWNEHVPKDQIVYIVGDVAHGPDSVSTAIRVLTQMNGRKILIRGNHDYAKTGKKYGPIDYGDLFIECHDGPVEVKYNKRRYVLFHYPMETWNASTHGSIHLHGHSHGQLPPRLGPKEPLRFGRRLDVGVDCHDYYPLPFSTVEQLIEAQMQKMFLPLTECDVRPPGSRDSWSGHTSGEGGFVETWPVGGPQPGLVDVMRRVSVLRKEREDIEQPVGEGL